MTTALDLPGIRLSAEDLIALRSHALRQQSDIRQFAALPGGHATRSKGQGIEIADIREYLPGDDIRHLDRSSTARTGRLHVKQFQAERDSVRIMVVDMRSSMLWGLKRAFLSVVAAEACVLDAWRLIDKGGRVGLMTITDAGVSVVPPRGRVRAMLDVIAELVQTHAQAVIAAQEQTTHALSLDHALQRLSRIAPSGSEIVIASSFDGQGQDLRQVLDGLAQRRKVNLLLVSATDTIPSGRYPVMLASGRSVNLDLRAREATGPVAQIAGREAVVVDASATVDEIARATAGHSSERVQ